MIRLQLHRTKSTTYSYSAACLHAKTGSQLAVTHLRRLPNHGRASRAVDHHHHHHQFILETQNNTRSLSCISSPDSPPIFVCLPQIRGISWISAVTIKCHRPLLVYVWHYRLGYLNSVISHWSHWHQVVLNFTIGTPYIMVSMMINSIVWYNIVNENDIKYPAVKHDFVVVF